MTMWKFLSSSESCIFLYYAKAIRYTLFMYFIWLFGLLCHYLSFYTPTGKKDNKNLKANVALKNRLSTKISLLNKKLSIAPKKFAYNSRH